MKNGEKQAKAELIKVNAQCTESSRQGIFGKIAKFEFFGPKVDF